MGGIPLEDVIEAYYDCRKTKRNTVNALSFEWDYEHNCIELWKEINAHRYKPRRSIAFVVEYPVKREIFAADFRDRIVHHIIARRIYPLLEQQFITDSYSTQKGKGTLFGIQRIANHIKDCSENYSQDCYIMKLDIQVFFMSISKQLLYTCITRFLQERYHGNDLPLLMYLLKQTIFNRPEKNCIRKVPRKCWRGLPVSKSLFGTDGSVGLPIGNLTSQLLALLFLDELDHLVIEEWDIPHYGRYVDDMVLVHPSKEHLLAVRDKMQGWLQSKGLLLHPKKMYLQYSVNKLFETREDITEETLEHIRASMNSYLGMMKHFHARRLFRNSMMRLNISWYKYVYFVSRGRNAKMVLRSRKQ